LKICNLEKFNDSVTLGRYLTIEQYFDLINHLYKLLPAEIAVKHHKTLGYPVQIKADIQFNIVDDEIDYQLSDLKELKIN